MTKLEFISELENLLQDVSDDERLEAIQFYQNYFEDAGEDKEQSIIEELGSPLKVATSIKADILTNWQEAVNRGYFTEKGYEVENASEPRYEIMHGDVMNNDKDNHEKNSEKKIKFDDEDDDNKRNYSYKSESRTSYDTNNNGYKNNSRPTSGSMKVLLIILLIIFGIPVGIPLLASVFGVVVSVIATIVLLWFSFAVMSVALLFSGLIVIIVGIVKLITVPAIGLCLAGSGLIVFGIGLLVTMATIGISSKLFPLIPGLFRGFINLCRIPFQNRRVEA